MDLSDPEALKRIDNAIGAMPQQQRDAFLLHRLDDLDYIAIGARLRISIEQVEDHISAALKALRDAVG